MSSKTHNIKILKELVITNKISSKKMLLEKLNYKLGRENSISMSSLSNYLSKSNISIDKKKKYYYFKNESALTELKAKILSDWINENKITVTEPILLGTSIINDKSSLYFIVVRCPLNYEKITFEKLFEFINPSFYQINSESIFFYYFDEELIKIAYKILTNS